MFYYIDYTYLVLVIPAFLLVLIAQAAVKSTFAKYSRVATPRGLTGAAAAERILRANGVYDVRVERVQGELTDHYDPRSNVIRLSDSTYASASVAAVGVAAHEAGHAVQYAEQYFPIKFRAALVPIVNIGSRLAFPLILVGMLTSIPIFYGVGIIAFGLAVLFQLATLPVEFNASSRALRALEDGGLLVGEENGDAKKVLRAAAMTYVAALALALAQFLRLVILFGGRGRRRD